MKLNRKDYKEIGYAFFVRYEKNETILDFYFGPSDWDLDFKIKTTKGSYSFKDLLLIPEINNWVLENRYINLGESKIKDEMIWKIDLLKISLSFVE